MRSDCNPQPVSKLVERCLGISIRYSDDTSYRERFCHKQKVIGCSIFLVSHTAGGRWVLTSGQSYFGVRLEQISKESVS
jgi:hypothetical protein